MSNKAPIHRTSGNTSRMKAPGIMLHSHGGNKSGIIGQKRVKKSKNQVMNRLHNTHVSTSDNKETRGGDMKKGICKQMGVGGNQMKQRRKYEKKIETITLQSRLHHYPFHASLLSGLSVDEHQQCVEPSGLLMGFGRCRPVVMR